MNSNKMKECLVSPAVAELAPANPISSKEIQIMNLPVGSRTYETPVLPANVKIQKHNVG